MNEQHIPSPNFSSLPGTYVGDGAWTDTAGDSRPYRVTQKISITSDGIAVEYTHDFYEEGTVTSGVFSFQRQADALLRVFVKGVALGDGYMFGDYFHYYIKAGDKFVQASYQMTSSGILVNGSSSSNAQGKFIAWHEELRKQAGA